MRNVNTLIIEDDLTVALALKILIQNTGCNIMAAISDLGEALYFVQKQIPDLIFINIDSKAEDNYPELFQYIRSRHIPMMMIPNFKTFENVGINNGSKPCSEIMRSLQVLFGGSIYKDHWEDCTLRDSIFLRKGAFFFKVPFNNILYIRAEGNYCEFQTVKEKFVHRIMIDKMHPLLPRKYFLKTHRSYIVNLQYIKKFSLSKNEIILNDFSLPIGRSYKARLLDCLQRAT